MYSCKEGAYIGLANNLEGVVNFGEHSNQHYYDLDNMNKEELLEKFKNYENMKKLIAYFKEHDISYKIKFAAVQYWS